MKIWIVGLKIWLSNYVLKKCYLVDFYDFLQISSACFIIFVEKFMYELPQ